MDLMIFANLKKNMAKTLFFSSYQPMALFRNKIKLPVASINPPVASTITTTQKQTNISIISYQSNRLSQNLPIICGKILLEKFSLFIVPLLRN